MKNSEAIDAPQGISYEDIRLMYHTGKFIRDYGSQDKKAGRYRIGVMTKIGDIEEKVWIQYAEELIHRFGDEALFKQLKSWYIHLRSAKPTHEFIVQFRFILLHFEIHYNYDVSLTQTPGCLQNDYTTTDKTKSVECCLICKKVVLTLDIV